MAIPKKKERTMVKVQLPHAVSREISGIRFVNGSAIDPLSVAKAKKWPIVEEVAPLEETKPETEADAIKPPEETEPAKAEEQKAEKSTKLPKENKGGK
jgi:hypothetical protein